jgi:SAM-dependent methyltransferase
MSGFTNPQAMWDKRFSTPDYVFGEEPNAFLVSQAARLGKGHALALAAKHHVNINFTCSDWQSFDWPEAHYDLVAGIFFQFATPEERAELFEKIKHSLKPGGVLVIQGYGKNQLTYNTGGPGKLAHLYNEALMLVAFGKMDILDLRTYEANITEGTGHQGMSGLLGLTARKPV